MNINLIRLKGLALEMRRIRETLERIADCMEMEMSQQGYNMRPPKVDTSGPDPTMDYTDEERDFIREEVARFKGEEEAE